MTNDDKVLTVVRDGLAGVRMTASVDQIAAGGRALRRRRRLPVVGGAAAAIAAGVAAGVLALAPASPSPAGTGGASRATLAAYTVTSHDDTVRVTLNKLESAWSAAARAGLQRELRADGVPATVVSDGPTINVEPNRLPAGYPRPVINCYPSALATRVFTTFMGPGGHGVEFRHGIAYEIHPAMIPHGTRVLIQVSGGTAAHGQRPRHPGVSFLVGGLLITPGGRCLI